MSRPRTQVLALYVYLLSVCMVCLAAAGGGATVALLGAVRMRYPALMMSGRTWDDVEASHSRRYGPSSEDPPSDAAVAAQEARKSPRTVMKRERHLGRRQLLWGAAVMVVAMLIFLPHWWAARRPRRQGVAAS